jgi:predicted Abi (CAAX) family protease
MGFPLNPLARAAARVRLATTTLPNARGWRRLLIEAAWAIPAAMLLCWAGGLLRPGLSDDPELLLRLAVVAIVAPALGEELLFRVLLLPPPGAPAAPWRLAIPVLLFVLWHPPQVLLFGPGWGAVVLNPWFLAAVAAVGVALTRLYRATGSIWPPVLLHWTIVVGWKAFFGAPSPWTAS